MRWDFLALERRETWHGASLRKFVNTLFLSVMSIQTKRRMSLSLGFNQQRPQRVHSLPGATHSQAVPPARRRRPPPREITGLPPAPTVVPPQVQNSVTVPLHSSSAPMLSRRMQFLEDAFKKSTELAEQFRNTRDEASQSMQDLYEQVQIVYGVAQTDLTNDQEEVVIEAGKPVALFYPMMASEDGKTFMKAKIIDAVTAKLTLATVCVYDPTADVKRKVTNFSAFPH
jgi:hypothetical protein